MTTLRQVMELVDAYAEERCKGNEYNNRYFETSARHSVLVALKNYKSPPKRQWIGLTDEEIQECWLQQSPQGLMSGGIDFARAIESKLKEKNGIKGEA